MNDVLPKLLLACGTASVLAAIPQLIRLIKLKHAHEFSLFSWIIWLVYQLVSVAYSADIKAYAYVAINSLWVVFYLVMVILIFRYRQQRPRRHRS